MQSGKQCGSWEANWSASTQFSSPVISGFSLVKIEIILLAVYNRFFDLFSDYMKTFYHLSFEVFDIL